MRLAVVDYRKGNLKSVERGLIDAGADAFITSDAADIAGADGIVLPGVGAFADAADTMCELGQMQAIRERIAAGVPFLGICLGMHLMFEEGMEGAPQEDDEVSSNNALGLAVLPGVVAKMPQHDAAGTLYKVPHVGWNSIVPPVLTEWAERLDAAASCDAQSSPLCDARRGTKAAWHRGGAISGTAETLADFDGDKSPSLSERAEQLDAVAFASPLFEGIPAGEHFYFTHSYIAPDTPATVAVTEHSVVFPCAVQYGASAFGVQFHPEKSSDAGARVLRNFVEIAKGARA